MASSGLSGPAYAAKIGLSVAVLGLWKRRRKTAVVAAPAPAAPVPSQNGAQAHSPGLSKEDIERRYRERTNMTRSPFTPEEERALVAEFKASGMSGVAYCASKGLPTSAIYAFQSRNSPDPKRHTLEEQQQILEELEASGMSVMQFCRERGLPKDRIYKWKSERKKLAGQFSNKPTALEPSNGTLICPRCGCDVLGEIETLATKLRAMISIKL